MHKIQYKIFISTVICVILVSLAGTLYLYRYMSRFIYSKSQHIDNLNLTTISNQISSYLENTLELGLECSNDSVVEKALQKSKILGIENSTSLDAQQQLNTYLSSFVVNDYVDKLLVFNETGLICATNSRVYGSPMDYANILNSPFLDDIQADAVQPPYTTAFIPSIADGDNVFAAFFPVYGESRTTILGYIYLELGLDLFSDILQPYTEVNHLFLTDSAGTLLTDIPGILPENPDLGILKNGENEIDGSLFLFSIREIPDFSIRLYSCTELPLIDDETRHLIYVILVVLCMGFGIGIILALFTSRVLAKPIQKLNHRLELITQGDFSYDSEIERPHDEIGQIGHTVNEMTTSFKNLLRDSQEMYRQQRTIEIALLQSQVNPHFLYNTLDSIRWMAVIQKNKGIEEMTGSLSSLLKNLAKGTEDHILLSEELSLVNDYISIQSIRYMGVFELVNHIPEELYQYRILKFTLQPLIENAIFHGIEPKGTCGTITLSGSKNDTCLCLHIRDDGVGIPQEKLDSLLSAPQENKNKGSLSSIGVYNVNQRLKLVYGTEYGLFFESQTGIFTDVLIKIPLEL